MAGVKQRVLDLCERNGTKVGTLERVTSLSNGTIKKWNDDSVPNGQTLEAIADYFGVSVDYLLGREPQLQAAAAHFDVDKLTDEGRAMLDDYYKYLAERFSKE